MAPIARVAAPPVTPPRFSLVASAGAGSGERWETGFKWPGVICDDDGGLLEICTPDSINFSNEYECADREFTPYIVFQPVQLSTFPSGRDAAEEAGRQLARYSPAQIETEFWLGEFAQAEGIANAYLTDGNAQTVGSGPLPLFQGLAAIQSALVNEGVTGFIHMPALVFGLIHLNAPGSFNIDGTRVYDVFGNTVVPGAGYPNDETLDTATIYATGEVEVRLGEVEFTEAVDQTNNKRFAVAYRAAAASFDPCVQLEVALDLCNLNCTA